MTPGTPQYEKWMAARLKHGAYAGGKESRTHYIWRTMLTRCRNQKSKDWPAYGGRGITVCGRWLKFENFLADMGEAHTGLSIDRIDNDGPYSPENCRWASAREQQRNKRTTRYYENDGIIDTLVGWAERLGKSKELLHWRFKKWGTFEKGKQWRELQKTQ